MAAAAFSLSPAVRSALLSLSASAPKSLPHYSYGTAGFRGLASTLDSVNWRMGVLGVLRSWDRHLAAKEGRAEGHGASAQESVAPRTLPSCPIVGLMITASHNAEPDNGLKLVDPSGEMLNQAWEPLAGVLANAPEGEGFVQALEQMIVQLGLEEYASAAAAASAPAAAAKAAAGAAPAATIFVAKDTRSSSLHLCDLVSRGASALGAEVKDFGLATTPQLHWVVAEANRGHAAVGFEDYYKTVSEAFRTALECKPTSAAAAASGSGSALLAPLTIDCANGVGSRSIQRMSALLAGVLPMELRNTRESGGLNNHCGAEHVQKSRALPLGFSADSDRGKKLAAVDGDADRLVYFFADNDGVFKLLDGDKTIALYTVFLRGLLADAGLDQELSLGIVQTAYANGASTIYMRSKLGIDVQFTNTGVKFLHARAVAFDVGVYFESNGHGTVVFSEKARARFEAAAATATAAGAAGDEKKQRAARCLAALRKLINQCVGDAVSDLLLVEVALHHLGWSLPDWDALYTDLPSSMLKVCVPDRSLILTTDAERRCTAPEAMQPAIDALVNAGPGGVAGVRRAFVRPSGTEDIVRVYAEAATRAEVDQLANDVCKAVERVVGEVVERIVGK